MRAHVFHILFIVVPWLVSFAGASVVVRSSAAKDQQLGEHRQRLTLLARRFAALRRAHAGHVKHVAKTTEAEAADMIGGKDLRRPIITGCLKECGYKEQTCVTQCQVCVEHNECRILGKCDKCLREAHDMRMRAQKMDKGILDDGGVSMMRDGMMAEMTRAKLQAIDRKRELRGAREGVLKAQREAEWAAEERHMAAMTLIEARQVLKGARLEVTRWKLRNAKKLKAMRARAREQRLERQKAERKLAAAKRKYSKAEKRLRIASNESATETNSSKGEDNDDVERLAREVEERQEAVESAERDVETTSADGEWLDRGLRRRVKSAQQGARKKREELLVARAHERVARERLEDAKEHYITAVRSSQQADKAAEDSELKLRKAPVSVYTTPQKANFTNDGAGKKDKLLRSSSPSSAGASWMSLLGLLGISFAAKV